MTLKDCKITFCFLLISFVALSQTTKKKPVPVINYLENVKAPFTLNEINMLKGFYKDKYEDYVLNDVNMARALKHLIRNRIRIEKIPNSEGIKKYRNLPSIRINTDDPSLDRNGTFNMTLFNPFNYKFQFFSKTTQLFKIEKTNYFLIIKPQH